jgi:hypothetical protein
MTAGAQIGTLGEKMGQPAGVLLPPGPRVREDGPGNHLKTNVLSPNIPLLSPNVSLILPSMARVPITIGIDPDSFRDNTREETTCCSLS